MPRSPEDLRDAMAVFERAFIMKVLLDCWEKGQKPYAVSAAKRLGISLSNFYKKASFHKITVPS